MGLWIRYDARRPRLTWLASLHITTCDYRASYVVRHALIRGIRRALSPRRETRSSQRLSQPRDILVALPLRFSSSRLHPGLALCSSRASFNIYEMVALSSETGTTCSLSCGCGSLSRSLSSVLDMTSTLNTNIVANKALN